MEDEIQRHATHVQVLVAPPDQVDAGTDVTLQVQVSCPEACSLLGGQVRILDQEGTVVQEVDLASFDGTANATQEFTFTAPVEPGSYTWTALFVPPQSQGEEVQHEQSSAPLTFTVVPHTISLSVWGVPFPVLKGQEFPVKIGAKCSADCSLAGLPYAIYDEQGNLKASGQLGEELLPMTGGLRWSEQKLVAPDEEGLYTWRVECLLAGLELPHQAADSKLRLKTARPPEYTVTVEVIDLERRIPVKQASVYIHPYRTFTDERGMATLKVTKDKHELYIKERDYWSFQTTLEVDKDVTIKAELMWTPEPYA
jgi:hypothetical protein